MALKAMADSEKNPILIDGAPSLCNLLVAALATLATPFFIYLVISISQTSIVCILVIKMLLLMLLIQINMELGPSDMLGLYESYSIFSHLTFDRLFNTCLDDMCTHWSQK